tara:strand:+ start:180 stop:356 length:177 start_codon:yes stop_codon:yes gene_type:complete
MKLDPLKSIPRTGLEEERSNIEEQGEEGEVVVGTARTAVREEESTNLFSRKNMNSLQI